MAIYFQVKGREQVKRFSVNARAIDKKGRRFGFEVRIYRLTVQQDEGGGYNIGRALGWSDEKIAASDRAEVLAVYINATRNGEWFGGSQSVKYFEGDDIKGARRHIGKGLKSRLARVRKQFA